MQRVNLHDAADPGRIRMQEKKGITPGGSDVSRCSENHGRIVKSDEYTITFADGVVVRKGSMEIVHDPRRPAGE